MRAANGRFIKGAHWRPRAPHWDAEWLREQYVTLGRSTGEIALSANTTDAAILYWLKKHGIPRRTTSEARAIKYWGVAGTANPMHGKTGAANPRYVDGSSPERQRMYVRGEGREFLSAVRERDGHRCRRCGCAAKGVRGLHVHHIQSWAGNPALRFDKANAVTLCRGCHEWVHSRKNLSREFLA